MNSTIFATVLVSTITTIVLIGIYTNKKSNESIDSLFAKVKKDIKGIDSCTEYKESEFQDCNELKDDYGFQE